MKIAILTSGIMPVPAVQGGAVENLVDFYLEFNDRHRLHDITIYSVADKTTANHPALKSVVNHYKYVNTNRLTAQIGKRILHLFNRKEYYHYTIEYYLHKVLADVCSIEYDMVIIENRPGYALRLKDKTRAKLLLHLHNDLLNSNSPHGQQIYDTLDSIVCVSDYIAGRVRTLNTDDTKTITVHNGIDTSAFSPTKHNGIKRTDIGLSDNDFVLMFSGRINREKGISELIDAMVMLKQHTDIKLLILGSSFYRNADNENEFARQLKARASTIEDRIVFTGFIPYNDVPAYLCIANVAVLPSIWEEPFGLTVLEAQAMGLPTITTGRGGITEIADSNNAIILSVDKDLPLRLANAIIQLYEDDTRRKQMAKRSRERACMFTKEHYAEEMFKAIGKAGG